MDIDGKAKDDLRKAKGMIRNYQRTGSFMPDLGTLLANVCFIISMSSIIGMVGTLYWVGPDKPISGTLWLGAGTTGIVLFGALGLFLKTVNIALDNARKGTRGQDRRR